MGGEALVAEKERAGCEDKDCGDFMHCDIGVKDGGWQERGDLLPVVGFSWQLGCYETACKMRDAMTQ